MPDWSEAIRDRLIQTNQQFRCLVEQHSAYDAELIELSKRPYLTAQDQLREVELKKRKLYVKDEMERILHEHCRGAQSSAAR
jgi:uncharacterized protein YdcH (DUF465 family)